MQAATGRGPDGMSLAARPSSGSTPTSDSASALADAYADRHERLERFIFMYALPARLFATHGIELQSPRGYALLFVGLLLAILVPLLAVAAASDAASEWSPLRAITISATLAFLNVLALAVAQAAAYRISALHRSLVVPAQIEALIRWDRRWYSPGMSVLVGGAIALAFVAVLELVARNFAGVGLSAPTLFVAAVIALFLGQYSYSTAMIYFEFRRFTVCRFDLFALSPIDTPALQATASGLKGVGIVSITMFPLFVLVLLSVLPEASGLTIAVTGGFLALGYLAAGVGILFPLRFLGDIVKAEKQRLLEPLQGRLNRLVPDVPAMDAAEYAAFERLQSLHRTIADSGDSLLGIGSVARVAGAAVLSTITVVITALIQTWVQRLG